MARNAQHGHTLAITDRAWSKYVQQDALDAYRRKLTQSHCLTRSHRLARAELE
jgi:hypothetical protein